jgi:hypothetical protein
MRTRRECKEAGKLARMRAFGGIKKIIALDTDGMIGAARAKERC